MTWQIIGASVIGTSHQRIQLSCQDAHKYCHSKHGIMIAVADGLGSASQSMDGARIAVHTAVEELKDWNANLNEASAILQATFSQARQRLEQQAQTVGVPLREYGTTLMITLVTEEGLATGHLGDGAIVALFSDGQLETVSPPERSEYVNAVMPLTAPDALSQVRFFVHTRSVEGIAMLSDGLQNLAINTRTEAPYLPFFAPFFAALETTIDTQAVSKEIENFLASERVCKRTDDDKTLVIARMLTNESITNHKNVSGKQSNA